MKRMHVHVSVESIENAVAFYSTLFAAQPSVRAPADCDHRFRLIATTCSD